MAIYERNTFQSGMNIYRTYTEGIYFFSQYYMYNLKKKTLAFLKMYQYYWILAELLLCKS